MLWDGYYRIPTTVCNRVGVCWSYRHCIWGAVKRLPLLMKKNLPMKLRKIRLYRNQSKGLTKRNHSGHRNKYRTFTNRMHKSKDAKTRGKNRLKGIIFWFFVPSFFSLHFASNEWMNERGNQQSIESSSFAALPCPVLQASKYIVFQKIQNVRAGSEHWLNINRGTWGQLSPSS